MFEQLMTSVMKADFWFSVLRITAPILFAALAAVIRMCNSAPSATVAMCRSGFKIVTSPSAWISAAVTSAGPLTSNSRFLASSDSIFKATFFKFKTICVTSSVTPSTVLNSCKTPSMSILVIAAPGKEASITRRRELPSVVP